MRPAENRRRRLLPPEITPEIPTAIQIAHASPTIRALAARISLILSLHSQLPFEAQCWLWASREHRPLEIISESANIYYLQVALEGHSE